MENTKNIRQNAKISDRFLEIRANFFGNSNRKFAQSIDINETTLSSICNGKTNAGKVICEKILVACPSISRAWLYFGEGEMIANNSTPAPAAPSATISNNTAPVAANGSTINQNSLADSERQLYERIIANLEDRVANQAEYIKILSDEHRGLVHDAINIMNVVNEKADVLAAKTEEVRQIGFSFRDSMELEKSIE